MIESIRYFGEYLILGEIASGGMGVVYLARQSNLNREVALKLIRSGALASRREVELFRLEAEAASSLSHPHIVRIYETNEHDGQPYVAMEFIEGASLAEQVAQGIWTEVKNGNRQRIRDAVALLVKLADAVHHAHQRGIIHRDLKPGNVMVNHQGEPFLTDFGLAKVTHIQTGLTRTGQIIGTPEFMSPEQAGGRSKEVTIASDVYGLGAILYTLLTLRPPFLSTSDNAVELLQAVLSKEPEDPKRHNAHLDSDLSTLTLKCLEKDSKHRYASAESLKLDLERWLRGEPIEARPVGKIERATKWARRHPVIAGLSGALIASMVIGSGLVTWQWKRAEAGWQQSRNSYIRLRLEEAERSFELDDANSAIATLSRLLRDEPTDSSTEERLVNALRSRRFLVPSRAQLTESEKAAFGLHLDPQLAQRTSSVQGMIASANPDGHIRIQPADGGQNRETVWPDQGQGVLRSLALSPDTRILAAASSSGQAYVWETSKLGLVATLAHPVGVEALAVHPQSQRIATLASNGELKLWALDTKQVLFSVQAHAGAGTAVRFSPDGNLLATGGDDGTIRLWQVDGLLPASERRDLGQAIQDLRFTDSGHQLMARVSDTEMAFFQWSSQPLAPESVDVHFPRPSLLGIPQLLGRPAERFHADLITATNLSRDGTKLATASKDGSARIWWTRTGEPIVESLIHSNPVNSVAFSADGERLATSAGGGLLRIWDANRGFPVSDWLGTGEPVRQIEFRGNGRSIVASSGRLWRLHEVQGPGLKWLPELAEALAGEQLQSNGIRTKIAHSTAAETCQRILDSLGESSAREWVSQLLGPSGELR